MIEPEGMQVPALLQCGPLPGALISYDVTTGCWNATAILLLDQHAPTGPSTVEGADPAAALQQLLAARFVILADHQCPPTVVSIDSIAESGLA